MQHLEDIAGDEVQVEDIDAHLEELAEKPMNGRQIRNAITTARQLALYKKKKMCYSHLNHVMKVASRFDKYLEEVHEEISDDQWAREQGFR